MPRLFRIRPEREPAEGGMVTFRRHLLLLLSAFTFQASWLLVTWAVEPPGPTPLGALAVVWGVGLAIVVFFLRTQWPRMACWLYVGAGLALTALIQVAFRKPVTLSLFAVPVLLAGLLLGVVPGLSCGVVAAALVVLLDLVTARSGATLYWVILLGAVCGIGVVAGQSLAQVDYWERTLVIQQQESIRQLRERQGELNRTLKALDEAYESLKRANDELRYARQEAEEARVFKEQFVANISHELRTPLNIIVGFAEMMYLSPENYAGVVWTPKLEGDIAEIYRANRYLQSLVNDILDLSRIDASRLPMFRELQDVRVIIAEVLETVAPLLRQKGLAYEIEWPENLPLLFVDRTRIRQVLLNLLNNAARYTDAGKIKVTVERDKEEVIIGVHDTGIGIPAEQLEHIFERFWQAEAGPRSRGGVGIGLALSRQFVQLHGGRMWVESQLGRGSVFRFSLPLPGTTIHAELRRIPERRQVDLSHAPVIVVDPDPSLADMLCRYLGDRPVLTANDLDQAAALVEDEHPLAVLINLPPDAPPEAWLKPLPGPIQRYDVPVFRCSFPSSSWFRRLIGFADCLTKPITREALYRILDRHCPKLTDVLVVDDDPGFVRLVSRMLEAHSHVGEIYSAYHGEHALRLARERKPGLILLDLLMPELDGYQTLQTLRTVSELGNIPVIAVTATNAAEAMPTHSSHFVLSQASGLSEGLLADLLNAALGLVRPAYAARE